MRYFGKTRPFAFLVASLCTAIVVWMLATQPCKARVAPAQDITRPDAPERASRPDISDEDTWLILKPVDYVWVACAIGANLLFFIRMTILFGYGYGIRYFDWVYQHRKLREIAEKQTSEKRRGLFNLINVLIPVLFISGAIVILLVRMAVPIVKALVVPTLNGVIERIS